MTSSILKSLCAAGLGALVLAACGGGGTTSVANVTATNARYGQNMVITFNGQGLDQDGLDASVEGPCSPPTRVEGSTANTLQFTCFVTGIGQVKPSLVDGGVVLASVRVDIPLPRMTLVVSDGARSGVIELELDPVSAPNTTSQFMAYANAGFYTTTVFHQVSPDSTIGGGAYTSDSAGGLVEKEPTRAAVALERTGLKNLRGTIALHRDAEPNSANAQFFINVVDNPGFDGSGADAEDGFAVFGKVIRGLDVVDVIASVPVRPDLVLGVADVPLTAVRISAVSQTR
jgi:cyclophilin family peptidyl-prolyl cis-trans isomerase